MQGRFSHYPLKKQRGFPLCFFSLSVLSSQLKGMNIAIVIIIMKKELKLYRPDIDSVVEVPYAESWWRVRRRCSILFLLILFCAVISKMS